MATLREALITQSPSLALQRAAADEIARLDALMRRIARLNELVAPDPAKQALLREHATRCFYVGRRYRSLDNLSDDHYDDHYDDFNLWSDLVDYQSSFCLDAVVP